MCFTLGSAIVVVWLPPASARQLSRTLRSTFTGCLSVLVDILFDSTGACSRPWRRELHGDRRVTSTTRRLKSVSLRHDSSSSKRRFVTTTASSAALSRKGLWAPAGEAAFGSFATRYVAGATDVSPTLTRPLEARDD
jgi:hypothetical protein